MIWTLESPLKILRNTSWVMRFFLTKQICYWSGKRYYESIEFPFPENYTSNIVMDFIHSLITEKIIRVI